MKKGTATMRQINAVQKELEKKLHKVRSDWRAKHPAPSWEVQLEWERKHGSPERKHEEAEEKLTQAVKAKHDALIFDASMGRITADELYARAKALLA